MLTVSSAKSLETQVVLQLVVAAITRCSHEI